MEAVPESIRGLGGARGGVGTELCLRRTADNMPPNPEATLLDDEIDVLDVADIVEVSTSSNDLSLGRGDRAGVGE